jgi:hypothetical protein
MARNATTAPRIANVRFLDELTLGTFAVSGMFDVFMDFVGHKHDQELVVDLLRSITAAALPEAVVQAAKEWRLAPRFFGLGYCVGRNA